MIRSAFLKKTKPVRSWKLCFCRFQSSETSPEQQRQQQQQQEAEKCKKFLAQLNRNTIPKSLYNLKYSRSSGPGGQNVNKLSTKATLTMNEGFLGFLPKLILDQLISKNFKYFNKQKLLVVVQSEATRSRENNVDDCFHKLTNEINSLVYFRNTENDTENEARWKKIKKVTNEHRLDNKKKTKQKKESRKKPLLF